MRLVCPSCGHDELDSDETSTVRYPHTRFTVNTDDDPNFGAVIVDYSGDGYEPGDGEDTGGAALPGVRRLRDGGPASHGRVVCGGDGMSAEIQRRAAKRAARRTAAKAESVSV